MVLKGGYLNPPPAPAAAGVREGAGDVVKAHTAAAVQVLRLPLDPVGWLAVIITLRFRETKKGGS